MVMVLVVALAAGVARQEGCAVVATATDPPGRQVLVAAAAQAGPDTDMAAVAQIAGVAGAEELVLAVAGRVVADT